MVHQGVAAASGMLPGTRSMVAVYVVGVEGNSLSDTALGRARTARWVVGTKDRAWRRGHSMEGVDRPGLTMLPEERWPRAQA